MRTKHAHPSVGSRSPEMALLGLLYGGVSHGYQLHRRLLTDLGQIWHLSQSQAYAILNRLEERGDIFAKEVPQEKLPPRRLLHITPQGERRFLTWLEEVSPASIHVLRTEFLTRLYFLERYFPAKVLPAFARQRAAIAATLQRLQQMLQDIPETQRYNRLSLSLRLTQLQSALDWMEKQEAVFACPERSVS